MSLTNSPCYTPYGAYELKATYQRNLTLGTVIVTFSVFLLVSGGWLFSSTAVTGGIVDSDPRTRDTVLIVVDLPTPITITRAEPDITVGTQPAAPIEGVVSDLVPVADELVIEENVMATQEEISNLIDGQGGGLVDPEGTGVSGRLDFDGAVVEEIDYPDPNAFIAVDQAAEMVHHEKPTYPRLAQQAGLEGDVWIKALVDTDGTTLKALVLVSSGTSQLDEAAVEAAYKNRYKPAIKGGEPVMMWVSYKVVFELD